MADSASELRNAEAEIARLNKIVRALMNRAERSTSAQGSDFGLFQTTIMLEQQVRERTRELEDALRENERITRNLRESEAKLRSVVGQSLIGVAIVEDGLFTYTNKKFDEIFGYSAEEMSHLRPVDLAAESDRQYLTGPTVSPKLLLRGRRKNGEEIDVENHSSVVMLENKKLYISLVLDVTERIRAEREIRQLKDALQDQAIHDQLTGLYNRRYLEETLARELIYAARHEQPLSAIMSDIDHFKAVNDDYGHQAGDEMLRSFGALFNSLSRGSDICCRYGGEEFLLVMPNISEADACARAEQLRQALEASEVTFEGNKIRVTASFGVATFPQQASSGDTLVAAADRALYAAKHQGRNRVVASSSLPTKA